MLAAAGRRRCACAAREVAAEAQREGTVLVNGLQAIIHQACTIAADCRSLRSITEHAADLHYNTHAVTDEPSSLSARPLRACIMLCSMAGLIVEAHRDIPGMPINFVPR